MTRAFAVFIASSIAALLASSASAQQAPLPAQATPTPPVLAAPQAAAPQVQPPATTGQRAQTSHAPTPTPQGRTIQAFAVTLLVADMQPGGTQDDVPQAARKAVADLKDFLPYKSYRLVDAQWIRSSGGGPVESRLKGLEQQEYGLRISGGPAPGGLSVRFVLSESPGGMSAATAGAADLFVRRDQLRAQLAEAQKKFEMGVVSASTVQALERDLQTLTVQLDQIKERAARAGQASPSSAGGTIMDANFRMELDETVVVGTSRVKGDKALIALLTAVGTKAPGVREPD